jgi:hypothetical protein
MRFNRKKFKKRKRMKMLMSNKMLNKCKKKDIQMMDNMSNRNMMMSKILREMERTKLTKIKCLMLSMD